MTLDAAHRSPLGPTLETPRLILRPPIAADFEPWAALMADPSTHFIGGPQHPAVAWRGMATMTGAWVLEGFSMFSVIEKASGRWIGRLGPWRPYGWPGPEVGWGLLPDACGRGYATEGSAAAIDWAFDALGWTEVIHTIDPGNLGSIAVAERLGSRHRGAATLPPPLEHWSVEVYGQTRDEWKARRALGPSQASGLF